ncbi:MAG TPA: phospho-N-acetylmuramoyl-pentapeptide-transferase [Dehalococcoidia bacterium]|nr:phospho-N-acetylmuramoyl-pentapeptide-transferase [Dehalococcoidia bacterium]
MSYALFAGCAAMLIALLAGYPLVGLLRARKLGKAISADGPESHLAKAGTPTMGGLLFIVTALAVSLVLAVPKDRHTLLPIAVAALLCALGWYDDLGTLIDREKRDAHDRTTMILKLAGFTIVSIVAAYLLYGRLDAPRLLVPHYGSYDIGPLYVVVAVGVMVSLTSAVGVTDGLDTLAGSTSAMAFGAFGAIALMQHQTGLAALCFAFAGALAGFLWHNAYPARVFMGDSGSLPLGGTLAVVALMTGWWLLVPVIGVVFVAEILSNVIQIGSYRLRGGRRVFKMAPLHHHFEQLGVPETRIAARFLVVALAGALLGVGLAALK